jgi:hypothetical protein
VGVEEKSKSGKRAMKKDTSRLKSKKEGAIFFSHSTADQELVIGIKRLISKNIPETNKIFVSSDGQSIRYGRNWLSEIEFALKTCDIMFAFVSNSSIASPWLHYEVGYVSARNIPVVPICISGFDISMLPFPIKMSHGFEFDSSDSLNKILLLLKEHVGINSSKRFTKNEFNSLGKRNKVSKVFGFSRNAHLIERIKVSLDQQDTFPPEKYRESFSHIGLQTRFNHIGDSNRKLFEIDSYGIKFIKDDEFKTATFESIGSQATILSKVIGTMKKNDLIKDNIKSIQFILNGAVSKELDPLRFAAKVENTDINLFENNQYEYKGIVFAIYINPFNSKFKNLELNVYKIDGSSDLKKVGVLLDYMLEKGILYL